MDEFARTTQGKIFLANIQSLSRSFEGVVHEMKRANDLKEKELQMIEDSKFWFECKSGSKCEHQEYGECVIKKLDCQFLNKRPRK